MRRTITIFGISGRTGRALLAAAAPAWTVRGFVRSASTFPGADVFRGTFDDPASVARAVTGADAVCCVLGPRPPHTEPFCAPATAAIVAAMRAAGCRRLVCLTGAMIGPALDGNRSRAMEWMAAAFTRKHPRTARDRVEQERVVAESGLEWTIVKPPRLTDGPARGRVQAHPSLRVGLLSKIARADLAAFMLSEVDAGRSLGQRVFVKG